MGHRNVSYLSPLAGEIQHVFMKADHFPPLAFESFDYIKFIITG